MSRDWLGFLLASVALIVLCAVVFGFTVPALLGFEGGSP